jgi:thiamine biosynthesis lipoprotein
MVNAQLTNQGMSTIMTHHAIGKHANSALKAIRKEAIRMEGLMSRFTDDSEISKINRDAGFKSERISKETVEVLTRAIEFSQYSQGLFDITIGPLITLWNTGRDNINMITDEMIKQALRLVNYNNLKLDFANQTAGLEQAGQMIDLGGIGKGYVGDKFVEIFRKYDISSAFSNIGGNVVALGFKPDGSPWRVGIQHPRLLNQIIGSVSITNQAVVTSGDYQRYFVDCNGRRCHHILDPRTGYPAESGLVSVTVVADNSMDADALSTVLFISGVEKGLSLLKRYQGAEAIFINCNLQIYITSGLKDSFQGGDGAEVYIIND